MVQTFDFMSKNYKHVQIQKVTFSTKKRTLDTALHKKTMCTPIKQRCIHTPIPLSTQRLSVSTQCLPFTTTLS